MKTNVYILRKSLAIIIAAVALSSCSKKDTATNDLTGTWNTATISYTATIGGMDLTQYLTSVLNIPPALIQVYVQAADQAIRQSVTGKIQINGDNTYSSTLGGVTDSGTWSLSPDGKTLSINSSTKGALSFNVVDLTSGTLHLQTTETEHMDINGDGTPETIDIAIDESLTKG